MTWGLRLYFPSKGRCSVDFYYPYKSITSARSESVSLGYSGKHTNHYTTKVTHLQITKSTVLWHSLNFVNLTDLKYLTCYSGKITTISTHCLNYEHSPLCALG
jgi:hypothetical protein